jgi:hypothetical protein
MALFQSKTPWKKLPEYIYHLYLIEIKELINRKNFNNLQKSLDFLAVLFCYFIVSRRKNEQLVNLEKEGARKIELRRSFKLKTSAAAQTSPRRM